jgi:hypothetical protein
MYSMSRRVLCPENKPRLASRLAACIIYCVYGAPVRYCMYSTLLYNNKHKHHAQHPAGPSPGYPLGSFRCNSTVRHLITPRPARASTKPRAAATESVPSPIRSRAVQTQSALRLRNSQKSKQSIAKQRGAEISSSFWPQKHPAGALIGPAIITRNSKKSGSHQPAFKKKNPSGSPKP